MDDPAFCCTGKKKLGFKTCQAVCFAWTYSFTFAAYLGIPLQKYASFKHNGRLDSTGRICGENQLRMDGYSLFSAGRNIFSALKGQQTQSLAALEVLPCCYVGRYVLGFLDLQTYMDNYGRYLELHKKSRKSGCRNFGMVQPVVSRWSVPGLCPPSEAMPNGLQLFIPVTYIRQNPICPLGKQEEDRVMENPARHLQEIFGPVFSLCQADHYCYMGILHSVRIGRSFEWHTGQIPDGNYHTLADAVGRTKISANFTDASNKLVSPAFGGFGSAGAAKWTKDMRTDSGNGECTMHSMFFSSRPWKTACTRIFSVYGDSWNVSAYTAAADGSLASRLEQGFFGSAKASLYLCTIILRAGIMNCIRLPGLGWF